MKLVFFGDSITEMRKSFGDDQKIFHYGSGFVFCEAVKLSMEDPLKYEVINSGVGGNRIVDLYSRVKVDVWNYEPDVITILAGVNDIWAELDFNNGVDLERFEKVYRMLIEDTQKKLPKAKIIIMEPFFLKGLCTEFRYNAFVELYKYAAVVKKIAEDYDLAFVPLQEKFNEAAAKYNAESFLFDGVHPDVAGAALICEEWYKVFKSKIDV